MSNTILVKRSAVPGKVPTQAQVQAGELAMNTADKKLYFSTGSVIAELANALDVVGVGALGVANGVATLDSGGKVPTAQLPDSVVGGLNYRGTWNASTNTPTLVGSTGTKGYYYKVSVAGSSNIDGSSSWTVGDLIVFNGVTWDLVQGGTSDVTSVFGRVGPVVLTTTDITTTLGFTPYNAANPAGYISANQNISVTGDATASGTTSLALTLASTGVGAGTYNNVATSITPFTVDAKGRITATGAAVTITPAWSSIASKPTTISGYGITDALGLGTAPAAALGTAAAGISTTAAKSDHVHQMPNVDALSNVVIVTKAVNDLLQWNGTNWVNRTISGAGLQPAGSYLTANQSISVTGDATATGTTSLAVTLASTGVTANTYGSASVVPVIDVDAKGRITGVTNAPITPAAIGAVANAGGSPSILQALFAVRPPPALPGRIFISTDTGTMYRDTGTSWSPIGINNSGSGTGAVFQTVTGIYGPSSGTTQIPADNTVPLNTEGTQIWSAGVTPVAASSKIRISSSFYSDCDTNIRSMTVALFRNGVCVQAQNSFFKGSGQPMQVTLEFVDSPASSAAVTYSMRVGLNTSGTWYVNQDRTGVVAFGGLVNRSTYVLMEIL